MSSSHVLIFTVLLAAAFAGCDETRPAEDGDLAVTVDQAAPGPDGKVVKPDAKVAKPDAKVVKPDAKVVKPDAKPTADGGSTFPGILDGVWLIGWSGGMNHFSWIRFSSVTMGGGKAQILAGKDIVSNLPLWNCSGATSWNITSKPNTLQLHMPSGSCNGMKSSVYTFQSFQKPPGGWPKGALLEAVVDQSSPTAKLKAYKYPASQCDAAMTACKDPLK